MKQNQVIAIVKGKKSEAEKIFTKASQTMGKEDVFSGIDRTYRPKTEEGDTKPEEKKHVQLTVPIAVESVSESLKDMFNMVATMDIGNCSAKADVKVNDIVIVKDVPATHLIFLEKKIKDLVTFIQSFPVLDASEEWEMSPNVGCYVSKPRETSSTAKVMKNNVLSQATKEHPAQVQPYTIDEVVGYWTTTHLSGNISAKDKKEYLIRARTLEDAVKMAREEANGIDVKTSDIGDKVLDYIFG